MDKGAARKIRASPTTAYPAPRIKFTLPLLPPQPPIIGNGLIHPLPGGRRRLAPCYSVLISQSSGNNKAPTTDPQSHQQARPLPLIVERRRHPRTMQNQDPKQEHHSHPQSAQRSLHAGDDRHSRGNKRAAREVDKK